MLFGCASGFGVVKMCVNGFGVVKMRVCVNGFGGCDDVCECL